MKTGKIFWYDPDMYRLWYADSKTSNIMHQPILLKKGYITPRQIRTQLLSGKFTSAHPPERIDVELTHRYRNYHHTPPNRP